MLKDIAGAAKMSPAKVHRYLASLAREGIIEQNQTDSRYDFGGAAREIGQAALARLDIVRIGTVVLADLQEQLRETVMLGVWGNGGVIVVYSLTAPKPIAIHIRVGSLLPILTSATGKIFAAYMPRGQTSDWLEKERIENRKLGLPTPCHQRDAIEDMLEKVKQDGFSVATGEVMAGIHALAVPVFANHDLLAAITTVGPAGSLDIRSEGTVVKAMKAASERFTSLIGGSAAPAAGR
jgi:DNA-binding IclR family transcriptional regulator